jgi:hypothetical protein
MRPFLAACAAVMVIGLCAAAILDNLVQEPASIGFATSGVRLSEPNVSLSYEK